MDLFGISIPISVFVWKEINSGDPGNQLQRINWAKYVTLYIAP